MSSAMPAVSVVIPAYNQARYLPTAIESALAQTFRDREIIVVDDGSLDDTPVIARQYGDALRYVRQENRGLAGARNTAIRLARGRFVALLDSDDEWLPNYLAEMLALADALPEATVYYCAAKCVDAAGNELAQTLTSSPIPPADMLPFLLRSNPLVPSTILMRRNRVIALGPFDESFRRVEDWDLWLRLLRAGHTFHGTPKVLVRYRLHPNSLSTSRSSMLDHVSRMVEKLFGSDDGLPGTWSDNKRRAYGGLYRHQALAAVMYGDDWPACGGYLHRALEIDPSLATDLSLFYELALGSQPLGCRGTGLQLDLDRNAHGIQGLLDALFDLPTPVASSRPLRAETCGTAYSALFLVAYNVGRFDLGFRFLQRVRRDSPSLYREHGLLRLYLKSFFRRLGIRRPIRSPRLTGEVTSRAGREASALDGL